MAFCVAAVSNLLDACNYCFSAFKDNALFIVHCSE